MSDSLDNFDSFNKKNNTVKELPNATPVLVLGILSIFGCFCYGLPGIIMGIIALVLHSSDKRLYESNPSVYENSYKNSKAGFICAIVGLSLAALVVIVIVVSLIANNGSFKYNY